MGIKIEFMPEKYMLTRKFVNFIEEVCPGYKPNVIYDIGSRDLEQSIEFVEMYPEAIVYAFEPNPAQAEICRSLSQNYKNIVFIETALGEVAGTVNFYVTPGNVGASSTQKPLDVPFASDKSFIQIRVDCMTIDSFIGGSDKTKNNIPDVLWMDAQGAELSVLSGMKDWIDNVKFIHCEASEQPYYEGHTPKQSLLDFLKYKGFNTKFIAENWHPYGEGDIIAWKI